MNIAILGGGIAGLSAAVALARLGLAVQIYERRSSIHNIGAGIVCWPNATFVLSKLGILGEVLSVAGRVSAMRRFSANGKELGRLDIGQLDMAMGYPSLSVLRADLMRILFHHVQQLDIPVHFGACVNNVQSDGQHLCGVTFTNGKSVKADAVLGAEGRMNSAARNFVTGNNQPEFQKFANWIGIFESDVSMFDDMSILDYWGIGLRFGIVPVSNRKAYWAGGIAASEDAPTGMDYRSELQSAFFGWPAPIEKIIAQVTNENTNKLLLYDHDPIQKWDRENVLLIGDAAHAALPTSGQGAAQALEDAWSLARQFASKPYDLSAIMSSFTRMRANKTAGITLAARSFARSLFNTDSEACAERDANAQRVDYGEMALGIARGWSVGLPIGG